MSETVIFVSPAAPRAERTAERGKLIGNAIYDIFLALGGTFSTEHGIGRAKFDLLESNRAPIEITLMRRSKKGEGYSLNPNTIFRSQRCDPEDFRLA